MKAKVELTLLVAKRLGRSEKNGLRGSKIKAQTILYGV